jgi:hypothetical protein
MRYALFFAWAAGMAAGAEYDPVDVLKRATQKVLAGAQEIPKYTCVETVNREYFEPAAATLPRACPVLLEQRSHPTVDMILRPVSTDRLRLDVTLGTGGELFSWAGASRFEDASIDHLVRHGPMATGGFAGFLLAIFETDAKRYVFDGSIMVNGRLRMVYSFQVTKSDSHYEVKIPNSWVRVAYKGTFWVDPETSDVVELTLEGDDLPLATGLCLTNAEIGLARVKIGDGQFLLPTKTRQMFVYQNAEQTLNVTDFTNCREFRGNSTVTFFPDSEAVTNDEGKGPSAKPVSLPAGLPFSLVLKAAIPTDTAAAGDPFSGELAESLRNGFKVLAPKGAAVEGHLMRVQKFFKPPEVMVVLKPEAVWIHGERVSFSGRRDWARVLADARKKGHKNVEILMPLRGEDNSGVFRFTGEHVTLPIGFRSDWKTMNGVGR